MLALLLALSTELTAAELTLPLPQNTAQIAIKYRQQHDQFDHNANTLFTPASTMKLLTAVAATASLGHDFRYQTQILSLQPPKDGVITGDVYIVFSGDPSLTSTDIQTLLAKLEQRGVNRITGDIYLVGQGSTLLHAPGTVWDDLGICYAAPVSSFIINKNCFKAQWAPKRTEPNGSLTLQSSQPVSIKSNAVFDSTLQQPFCDLTLTRLRHNQFTLEGCYPGSQALTLNIAITDPARFAQDKLTQMIEQSEIKFTGQVKLSSHSPADLQRLALHQSAPLTALINTMLLTSDNLIADSLLKRLGQQIYGAPGTFTKGSAAMTLILSQLGIDMSDANIVDGSGLSRYNLLSANHIADVLALVKHDPAYHNVLNSLPIAGETGTLRYKKGYTKSPLKGHVLAKTGSMSGVSNIAGFIKQAGKITASFVILQNGVSPQSSGSEPLSVDVLLLQQYLGQPPLLSH